MPYGQCDINVVIQTIRGIQQPFPEFYTANVILMTDSELCNSPGFYCRSRMIISKINEFTLNHLGVAIGHNCMVIGYTYVISTSTGNVL